MADDIRCSAWQPVGAYRHTPLHPPARQLDLWYRYCYRASSYGAVAGIMPQQPQDATARTVLVIEDDEDTLHFVEDLLIMSGYAVLGAASGQAALAHLAGHGIDVILLDRRLPDVDGVVLCRRLREHIDGVVPVIIVTADRSPGLEAAARAAGATDFLLKPYLPADLLRRLPPAT